jgi:hypothetical protein
MVQHSPLREHRRDVVEGEHGVDAGQRQRRARIDGADRGVRMRAAHERGMPGAGGRDVVDETSLADEQRPVLETRNACADQASHAGCQSAIALAALATTSLGVA